MSWLSGAVSDAGNWVKGAAKSVEHYGNSVKKGFENAGKDLGKGNIGKAFNDVGDGFADKLGNKAPPPIHFTHSYLVDNTNQANAKLARKRLADGLKKVATAGSENRKPADPSSKPTDAPKAEVVFKG